MTFDNYWLDIENHIAHVRINNPKKANAMGKDFWAETTELMKFLDHSAEVRVVVISGEGKHFSSGLDLSSLMEVQQELRKYDCEGRKREYLRQWIMSMQESFNSIEKCRKPVIAAIKGACIGAGIDLITSCDMRYATEDAYFSVKEVDLGIVADLGTLQRLSGIVSEGIARELAFTARTFDAQDAKQMHLLNEHFSHEATMMDRVMRIAKEIAEKSPLAIRGTKQVMNYSRNHSIDEGLEYVANWNMSMLMSKDLTEAVSAYMQKKKPNFSN